MPEDSGGQAFLVGLLLTTLFLGFIVLAAKTDYRFEAISISNEDYYSNVPLTTDDEDEPPEEGSAPTSEKRSSKSGGNSSKGLEGPRIPREKGP